jgi:FkbM family methyltransferase
MIVAAKLMSLRSLPESSMQRYVNGVLFEFDFDLDPALAQMYRRAYEIDVVAAMERFLRRGGVFIDVGANIGYLSSVAMGLVGKEGQVHSFEPVPECAARLRKLASANEGHQLVVNEWALGESRTEARIHVSSLSNIGWNTMVPDFMGEAVRRQTIEVETRRLDTYILANGLRDIQVIKIDAEGYEFPVLRGLERFFDSCPCLPPIICEICPAAYPLLGYSLDQLADYMARWRYQAFDTWYLKDVVDIASLKGTTNVLFRVAE